MSAQQATIKAVSPGEPWQSNYGPMVAFTLSLDGIEQPVQVNRKPDSPALTAGQEVWVDQMAPHPRTPGHLKGKLVPPPDQQRSFSTNGDDPTRASIEAQTCTKAAVEYVVGMAQTGRTEGVSAETVVQVAKAFFQGLEEMQA